MSSVKSTRDYLLRVHASLMTSPYYPHDGWVNCRCETAEKIRKLNDRLPTGKQIT